jgi:hypothetical protein
MEHDVARKIRSLASRREPLSESDACHLMVLCRKYLEHQSDEERPRYRTLRFFGDWAAHILIDRSPEGMDLLKRLNDTLVEVGPIASYEVVGGRLTEVLSFRQLRREIGEVFERVGVPDSIDGDQDRWRIFIAHVIEIIRDCPLVLGAEDDMSRRARELYAAIKANPVKQGCWVVGVAVVEVDYSQFSPGGKKEVCLQILTSDTTRLVIPMTAQEVYGPARM